jgi:hypothetical protein
MSFWWAVVKQKYIVAKYKTSDVSVWISAWGFSITRKIPETTVHKIAIYVIRSFVFTGCILI